VKFFGRIFHWFAISLYLCTQHFTTIFMKKILLVFVCLFSGIILFGQTELIDLQGVFKGKYRYDRLPSLQWRPASNQYSYYDKDKDAVIVVDLTKGKETEIFKFQQFYDYYAQINGQKSMDASGFKAQGGRVSSSFSWDDGNTLVFTYINPSDKAYYTAKYNSAKKSFQIAPSYANGESSVDESADGKIRISNFEGEEGYFVTDGEAHYLLCPDTGEHIVFGEPVHRSEWNINEGWYFSPNNGYIAFYRMDESMVEDYPLLQTSDGDGAAHIAYFKNIKYPMAGRTSHQVKVGIFDVKKSFQQKKTVYHYIETDWRDGEFLTNVTFSPDEKYLYITHLNREQNHSKLIRYEVATGKKIGTVLEERDDRFVEPQTRMIFLKDGRFIWQSDRDGWNHFYLYTFDGKLVKQITKGNWPVLESLGLDETEENLYFMTNKDNPVDHYLYSVNIKMGDLKQLTKQSGTHTIILSNDKKYFLDYFSSLHIPFQIYAGSTDSKIYKKIFESKNPYGNLKLGMDTIFSLKNSHGDDLYCEMILPPDFNKNKKYPCLVYVYGGPHSQLVTNTFMTAGVFLNYMAQKGYVIFVMDNRGTNNRGAEFEKCIHRQLGVCESEDQMVGIRYLQSLPFIDKERMGIDGWSFGGFMTLSMVTEHPEVFRSASCGGPVVNWEWYEIMYGERYMDTPQENPDGYAKACIIPKIKNLKCPLLIMHGQQDNTVVQQHSLELLHQSVLDDVQIQYFPYTTHEHNVRGLDRVQMWHKIEQFHDQYLMK